MSYPATHPTVCACGRTDLIHRMPDKVTGATLCYGCIKTISKFQMWLDKELLDDVEAIAVMYGD